MRSNSILAKKLAQNVLLHDDLSMINSSISRKIMKLKTSSISFLTKVKFEFHLQL